MSWELSCREFQVVKMDVVPQGVYNFKLPIVIPSNECLFEGNSWEICFNLVQ